jgi:hypothetical protein
MKNTWKIIGATFLMCSFFSLVCAQSVVQGKAPKLVVFVNIDELHTEHLLALRNKFSKHGFNQLVNQGAFFHQADYGITSSYNGAKQLNMYTGTYPCVHGVISDAWYDLHKNEIVNAFAFKAEDEVNHPDSGCVASASVLSSTFADELGLMHRGLSKIATVGFSPEDNAFFTHSKKAVHYWFDRTSGKMVSSVNDSVPLWLNTFNSMGFADLYLERQWGPVSDLKQYHEYMSGQQSELRHFLYNMNGVSAKGLRYQNIPGSPYGNVLLRDFVASLLINEDFGKDEHPDMVAVSFSCKPFVKSTHELFDAEVEDMLIRLDGQIESLIQVIKDNIGLEHTLFVFSSTPAVRWQSETLQKSHISAGNFNGKKTSALLNLYLMAIYGQGKWIKGYHDKQFYLNHELIKEKNINMDEFEDIAAKFLLEVSGVQNTISADDLRTNNYASGIYDTMQRSYYYGRSGDLLITLKPGWKEEVEVSQHQSSLSQHLSVPLIFYGWEVPAIQTFRKVMMTEVAPTISTILEIPQPNGCDSEAILEVLPNN